MATLTAEARADRWLQGQMAGIEFVASEHGAKTLDGVRGYTSGGPGASAMTVYQALRGGVTLPTTASHPLDADDMGRCLELLRVVPEWKSPARLRELGGVSTRWLGIVNNLPAIEAAVNAGAESATELVRSAMNSHIQPQRRADLLVPALRMLNQLGARVENFVDVDPVRGPALINEAVTLLKELGVPSFHVAYGEKGHVGVIANVKMAAGRETFLLFSNEDLRTPRTPFSVTFVVDDIQDLRRRLAPLNAEYGIKPLAKFGSTPAPNELAEQCVAAVEAMRGQRGARNVLESAYLRLRENPLGVSESEAIAYAKVFAEWNMPKHAEKVRDRFGMNAKD